MDFPARLLVLFLLLTACVVGWNPLYAKAETVREQQIKTAFLYNFVKFVRWPDSRLNHTITLCTVGDDWLNGALDRVHGKTVQGRVLTVRRDIGNNDLDACDIVYLGALAPKRRAVILTSLQKSATLTIADGKDFVIQGGVIGFVRKQQSKQFSQQTRLGFAINIDAANRNDLKINSQLLNLAEIIRE